ncbi:uncharacterized protein LOC123029954 [Varanus komodoensis]|uniref:uncharacterized protein LOC123029954 n=1 Tax=Varanus komodoensis TaxID=61221 RepID=UPI001CF7988A|nr:uncharacterized protein LOC123029954 [Varanus komodoensis]
MDLLFQLCTVFQLLLSTSSSFCGLHYVQPKWEKAHNVSPQQNYTLEAPWLVNVFGNGKRCLGVVLSSWWILTAANCFLLMKPSHIELTGLHGHVSTKTVSQFLSHRGFSSWDTMPNNDLGLIMLGEPLDLRKKDIWPVCVPRESKPYDTQEECRIYERGHRGPKRWLLKEIVVNALRTSECATHWSGTTEEQTLCVGKETSDDKDCRVPVGSPVICHDPASGLWEAVGIVSQSLHDCAAPVLAAQLLPHLTWLWREGAVSNDSNKGEPSVISPLPVTSETVKELPSTPQQPVTFPAGQFITSTVQPSSATLKVPVMLPFVEQIVEVPQTMSAAPLEETMTTKTLETAMAIKLPPFETTMMTIPSSPTSTESLHVVSIIADHSTLASKVVEPSPPTNHVIILVPSSNSQFTPVVPSTSHSFSQPSLHVTPVNTGDSTTRKTSTVISSTLKLQSSVMPTKIVISATTQYPSSVVSSTTGRSPQTVPADTQPHVIILPATPRPLPSPDSIIVPPTELPSPTAKTDVNQGTPVHLIVAGKQLSRHKREESLFLGPSLALVPPPSVTTSMIPSLQHAVRVTLKQCEIGLAWNSSTHTYQLKMAVLMDHRIGCGLRPDFLPKCPSCSEAEMGEFPWIVSLKLSIQHFCAGSILNPWWILTTANCANLIKNSKALALVQAGLVDVSKAMYSMKIRQALTHPNSLEHQDLHNLGLLQLEKPLEFGPHVAPVCLSDKADMINDFRNCWLPSWTAQKGGSSVLLRHPLGSISISSCNQFGGYPSDGIFCIKDQMGQEGVFKGDVGSPLICPDPQSGAWLQVGVLSSFDEACSHPYVFSSLSHYLPWLERSTKGTGHRYNLTVPWEWPGPAKNLTLLQEPKTLLAWISAQLSLPWQVLITTCENQNCEGSILNQYWVLTTAQCVREADPESTTVFVGLKHPKGHVQTVRVARIFPYKKISQYTLSRGYNMALLLLQKPITFDQHVTAMTFSPKESWDSCRVMGLQMLQSGDVQANLSAYEVKVLVPSDCIKEHPGISSTMYCIIRNSSSYLPAAAVGEGAALLCHLEAKNTTWSQVGLMSEPFPGSQTVVLSSSIVSYVDWMEETSKQTKHLLSLVHGRAACGPSNWALLLIMSLLVGAELS